MTLCVNRPGFLLNTSSALLDDSEGGGIGVDVGESADSTDKYGVVAEACRFICRYFQFRVSNMVHRAEIANQYRVVTQFVICHNDDRTTFELADGAAVRVSGEQVASSDL